ncbi:AAA family ATPase [Siminovitchia sediminis]|uniref:Nuclease SbcCD subunit C n=1 Tax=Siminovitchia sediminis TaxID=1274353 RepID=A0ABW4KJI8_9BACI
MKLLKISMNNFRQFYGEQTIEFAHGEENITIVFGENGKGKTGIFRALMFALYGARHIQQDNEKDDIHLVNFLALDEHLNMPVEGHVTIVFESGGKTYELKRTIVGFKANGTVEERIQGAEMHLIDEQGNYSAKPITDQEEINQVVNNMLHENIKDFFLFDAEKIETLAKTDAKVKQEVKTGIVKLLQIDKIDKSIKLLQKLHNAEKKRVLQNSQNLDLNRKQNEIEALTTDISNMEEMIVLKENNKDSCEKEIEDIKDKLAENEEVRKIQEKYDNEKEKRNLEKRLASSKKEEIKGQLVRHGYHLIMKDSYVSVKNYLDQILVDQQDLIPLEVIEKSLREHRCACCNSDLTEHPEYLQHIEHLKSNYKRSELTPLISMITSNIHDATIAEEEVIETINKNLAEYREIKNNVEELNKQLQRYNEDMIGKAQEQENLKHLESTLKNKEQMLQSLGVEIEGLKHQIREKEKQKEALEKEFSRLMRANESLLIDSKVLQYIEDLKSHLEIVFTEYSDEMRHRLTAEATAIFKELIDRKDKDLINRIDINEKYEIDIIGWDQINITQDISQGQRQVVALSFITALAKLASGGSEDINFPLFMDTPFGRISGNNRDHLIDNIPNLTSQWILLLTDTELSRTEEMRFKKTGKLGKWYKLEQITKGHSEIVPMEINEAMATRG